MKQLAIIVFMILPLLASSYYVKIGILSHDLDPETTKKIWSMSQNYSTMMSLEPMVEMAQWRDIENAAKISRSICSLIKKDVDALVYLGSSRWNPFISSYATNLDLPFIGGGVNIASFGQNEVCMLPDTTEAVADIIIRYGWNDFIFFYDSDNGPDHLQKVLSSLISVEFVPRVDGFWKIDSVSQASYYLKNLPPVIRRRFLLATSEEFADTLVNSVDKCDILLLTPVGTIKTVTHRRENTLIKISVVDTEDPVLIALENRLKTLSSFIGRGKPGKDIPDSAILHYDSSSTVDRTFNKIVREKPSAMKHRNIEDCFKISEEITETADFLKKVYIEHGATGKISFDEKGRRHDYKLNILQSSPYGDMEQVGNWSSRYGLQMNPELTGLSLSPSYAAYKDESPVKVTSILQKPFLLMDENQTFRGYVVDFLDELSKEIKMKFDLQLVKDMEFGRLMGRRWTGIIGELVAGETDMAVAPLTKSLKRQQVVHFSKNIMATGLNILLKKTESDLQSPTFGPFSFLSVWSPETWLSIIAVVGIYSAGSYAISRFIGSPDRVRALESKATDNLSPCGSVWFTVGSLFCRDTGIYPKYITHRLWALLWWLFCIFTGLLYVSMLTASLIKVRTTVTTTHSMKTSQEVLKEYIDTGLPVVGTVQSGSTMELFMNSNIGLYQQFGRILKNNPDSMVSHYGAGVKRVKESDGKYALIMESVSSEFIVNQEPCDTIITSGYLFTRPFAVALPKNSSLKEIIDHGIIALTEKGVLRELYEKWWHRQNSTCEDPALNILPKVYDTSMTLHEASGIFYLFIMFSLLSVAAAAVEYYIRTRKVTVR